MQPIDPSAASISLTPHVVGHKASTTPQERHWSMGLAPFFWLVAGPFTAWTAYLEWTWSDNPWKGEFWDGEMAFFTFVWLTFLLFTTVVAFAFGDFERLFRHLFRRSRS